MKSRRPWAGFPGADLVSEGVDDLQAGARTVPALLVALAESRLRAAGIAVPDHEPLRSPSHALYDLLEDENSRTAHGRYNALRRRIVSFARAAEHAHRR